MGDAGRFDCADLLQLQVADVIQQAFSTTQQDGNDVNLDLVDEAGGEDCCATPRRRQRDSLSPAACFACSSADSIPSVTKREVVSRELERLALVMSEDEDRTVERRIVSPPSLPQLFFRHHGPRGPNILRPIIRAPIFAICSSMMGVLSFTSPPAWPWDLRHASSSTPSRGAARRPLRAGSPRFGQGRRRSHPGTSRSRIGACSSRLLLGFSRTTVPAGRVHRSSER